jgi:hypothetical protein
VRRAGDVGGVATLLFSAGINDEKDGLAGSINPAP